MVPETNGGESTNRDIPSGVTQVTTHVKTGHDARHCGKEHSQHREPGIALGVARFGVVRPGHPRPPSHSGF